MNQHVPVMDGDTLARRNALVLAGAQALGGASPAIVISLGGIVGSQLVANQAFATVPVSLMQLGLATGVIPAAFLMRRLGRRNGYVIGALIGAVGASIAAAGAAERLFWLFCLGTFLCGLYSSYVQSYRFAAADTASEGFRPRAISWVMIGGLIAGVVGPQSVYWTRDLTPAAPFAASFLAQGVLALLAIGVVLALRAPPVKEAKSGGGRPLPEIMRQPKFIASVIAALVAYGLMSFVMTAAPIAMVACGHSVGDAALGIQWHVLAMYGPSFLTGRLIARFGKEKVTAAGLLLTAVAAIVGLSGLSVAHFWIALILLGIGWNFGFIGATALVTDCYRPEERVKVQAANDFLVFGSVAIASFSSGGLLSAGGWTSVNWLVFPPVAIALALVAWQGLQRRVAS
ncbi:Riboflavin transporter RfnT [Bosea sp. 62]|uniref:MFS transporter n=1 Tax=unclassified Bosea (in: a-proteobacteria) TaxID=2653178 RepID=UPI00125C169B|nr:MULTISPECIES: MFS transporter [unclassified Bosea (in: a-proteobacteria)]CAD5254625.1 Riboflavin transporter RfnT [Bosea sp. 21B]CAD5285822.1 Riboflavin transporter RfnT [Bosea sp. 7B]CAD5301451.1 Riboflavin transporter RfnT [Bosea sp. 46]VVT57558.1 Riboflavin transporter RfnT [Bosea sp. EC-HK365B]VXB70584.1 Riboflavin transporter RfnT [Bosea sp. 125]